MNNWCDLRPQNQKIALQTIVVQRLIRPTTPNKSLLDRGLWGVFLKVTYDPNGF